MTTYDEDLKDNPFHRELLNSHSDLLERASREKWIICIPRKGSILKPATFSQITEHIIIPDVTTKTYNTLNKTPLKITNDCITLNRAKRKVVVTRRILFKETFYVKGLKYYVYCLDGFLDESGEDLNFTNVTSLRDCIEFLKYETEGNDILTRINDACEEFLLTHEDLNESSVQDLEDSTQELFSKCFSITVKFNYLERRIKRDKSLLANLRVAIEAYMQSCLNNQIFNVICACFLEQDARVNKAVRNLQYSHFDYEKCPNFHEAKCELGKINRSVTTLGKFNCIKSAFGILSKRLTAEDLIEIFAYLIINSQINNWTANLIYLQRFNFSQADSEKFNERSFLLTTFEASLEYVKSGILFDTEKLNESDSEFVELIRAGDLEGIDELFGGENHFDQQSQFNLKESKNSSKGSIRVGDENNCDINDFSKNNDAFKEDCNGDGLKVNRDEFKESNDRLETSIDSFKEDCDGSEVNSDRLKHYKINDSFNKFDASDNKFKENGDEFENSKTKIGTSKECHNILECNSQSNVNDGLEADIHGLKDNEGSIGVNSHGIKDNNDRFGATSNRMEDSNDRSGANSNRMEDNNDGFGATSNRMEDNNDRFVATSNKMEDSNDRLGANSDRIKDNNDGFGATSNRMEDNNDRLGANSNRMKDNNDRFEANSNGIKNKIAGLKEETETLKNNLSFGLTQNNRKLNENVDSLNNLNLIEVDSIKLIKQSEEELFKKIEKSNFDKSKFDLDLQNPLQLDNQNDDFSEKSVILSKSEVDGNNSEFHDGLSNPCIRDLNLHSGKTKNTYNENEKQCDKSEFGDFLNDLKIQSKVIDSKSPEVIKVYNDNRHNESEFEDPVNNSRIQLEIVHSKNFEVIKVDDGKVDQFKNPVNKSGIQLENVDSKSFEATQADDGKINNGTKSEDSVNNSKNVDSEDDFDVFEGSLKNFSKNNSNMNRKAKSNEVAKFDLAVYVSENNTNVNSKPKSTEGAKVDFAVYDSKNNFNINRKPKSTEVDFAVFDGKNNSNVNPKPKSTVDFAVYKKTLNKTNLSINRNNPQPISISSESLCHPLCVCEKCQKLSRLIYSPDYKDEKGRNGLHIASFYGYPHIVDYFIQKGTDVNSLDYLNSAPIHHAALRGHQNALLLLLHSGADLNLVDGNGNTALHLSSLNGHENCVKALLYYSEYMGKKLAIDSQNMNGDTALHLCVNWGYVGIIKILLQYGASINVRNKKNKRVIDSSGNFRVKKILLGKKLNSIEATGNKSVVPVANFEQLKKVELLFKAIEDNDLPLACFYLGIPVPVLQKQKSLNEHHPLCNCDECCFVENDDEYQEIITRKNNYDQGRISNGNQKMTSVAKNKDQDENNEMNRSFSKHQSSDEKTETVSQSNCNDQEIISGKNNYDRGRISSGNQKMSSIAKSKEQEENNGSRDGMSRSVSEYRSSNEKPKTVNQSNCKDQENPIQRSNESQDVVSRSNSGSLSQRRNENANVVNRSNCEKLSVESNCKDLDRKNNEIRDGDTFLKIQRNISNEMNEKTIEDEENEIQRNLKKSNFDCNKKNSIIFVKNDNTGLNNESRNSEKLGEFIKEEIVDSNEKTLLVNEDKVEENVNGFAGICKSNNGYVKKDGNSDVVRFNSKTNNQKATIIFNNGNCEEKCINKTNNQKSPLIFNNSNNVEFNLTNNQETPSILNNGNGIDGFNNKTNNQEPPSIFNNGNGIDGFNNKTNNQKPSSIFNNGNSKDAFNNQTSNQEPPSIFNNENSKHRFNNKTNNEELPSIFNNGNSKDGFNIKTSNQEPPFIFNNGNTEEGFNNEKPSNINNSDNCEERFNCKMNNQNNCNNEEISYNKVNSKVIVNTKKSLEESFVFVNKESLAKDKHITKLTRLQNQPVDFTQNKTRKNVKQTKEHNEYKLNVNTTDLNGYTPLHQASKFGRKEILRLLLDKGANVNARTQKTLHTPLHLACINQRLSIVKELLQCGNCELDSRDFKGNTAGHYTCFKNDLKVLEVLLVNGCDAVGVRNNEGKSVLQQAEDMALSDAVKLIKEKCVVSCVLDDDDGFLLC